MVPFNTTQFLLRFPKKAKERSSTTVIALQDFNIVLNFYVKYTQTDVPTPALGISRYRVPIWYQRLIIKLYALLCGNELDHSLMCQVLPYKFFLQSGLTEILLS